MANNNFPLAIVIPIKELKGWLGKRLIIPSQRLGVVIDAGNDVITFPSGSHSLVSPWERLSGKAVGMRVGYIPTEPVSVQVQDAYLLSGDNILIDFNLTATAKIIDPGRFFREVVIPRGEIFQTIIDVSDKRIHAALSSLVQQYAANDMIRGLPTNRLAGNIQIVLNTLLQSQGLAIQSIDLILFWKSEDKVAAQEKILALEERIQDLEIKKKMAQIENQAQLEDFIHQLQPETNVDVGFRPVPVTDSQAVDGSNQTDVLERPIKGITPNVAQPFITGDETKPVEKTALQSNLGSVFYDGLVKLKSAANTVRHWRIEDLFNNKKFSDANTPSRTSAPLPSIVRTRTLYIFGLLVVGVGMTRLAVWLEGQVSSVLLLSFLTGIWGIVGQQIVHSLTKMIERREEIRQADWIQPRESILDDLAGSDRQQTDRLVRQQCGEELAHCRDILNDIRSRVFKNGQVDLALSLRDLERKFDLNSKKTLDNLIGAPSYMDTTLSITRKTWDRMLAYDEDLLCAANAISERAVILQQKAPEGVNADGVKDLEKQLDTLMHRFIGRSRTLQMDSVQSPVPNVSA
jgi:hypothetical protein